MCSSTKYYYKYEYTYTRVLLDVFLYYMYTAYEWEHNIMRRNNGRFLLGRAGRSWRRDNRKND